MPIEDQPAGQVGGAIRLSFSHPVYRCKYPLPCGSSSPPAIHSLGDGWREPNIFRQLS